MAFTEGLLLGSQSVWQAGLRGSERGQGCPCPQLPTVVGRWASSPGQVHQAELQLEQTMWIPMLGERGWQPHDHDHEQQACRGDDHHVENRPSRTKGRQAAWRS